MAVKNEVKMTFYSTNENVAIARVTTAAFAAQSEFTVNEIEDIKVAISEAVSNAIIHGYKDRFGTIELTMTLYDDWVEFIISDWGEGIEDIALARQPSFSTDPERMGLGFVFMESFMDELSVESAVNQGTTVRMIKRCEQKSIH